MKPEDFKLPDPLTRKHAQKLARPSSFFTSPVLPTAILGVINFDITEANLSLGKADNVDLKETLSDLYELLKKELEDTKEVPIEVTKAEIEIKF